MTELTLFEKFASFINEGGFFMWVILAVWSMGLAIAIERLVHLFRYDIDGQNFMEVIKKYVLTNDVTKAIQICTQSKALLPQVIRSGLKRANHQKEEIYDLLEAESMDASFKVSKRMSYLNLMANVSTLLGLLGTIYGLIESFSAVAQSDPSEKAKLLALGISKAMNTTALGLISAITLMVIYSYLNTRGHKIIDDLEKYPLKLVDLFHMQKNYPLAHQEVQSNTEKVNEARPPQLKQIK